MTEVRHPRAMLRGRELAKASQDTAVATGEELLTVPKLRVIGIDRYCARCASGCHAMLGNDMEFRIGDVESGVESGTYHGFSMERRYRFLRKEN